MKISLLLRAGGGGAGVADFGASRVGGRGHERFFRDRKGVDWSMPGEYGERSHCLKGKIQPDTARAVVASHVSPGIINQDLWGLRRWDSSSRSNPRGDFAPERATLSTTAYLSFLLPPLPPPWLSSPFPASFHLQSSPLHRRWRWQPLRAMNQPSRRTRWSVDRFLERRRNRSASFR